MREAKKIVNSILSGVDVRKALSEQKMQVYPGEDPEFYYCKDTKIIGDKIAELLPDDVIEPFDTNETSVWMHDSSSDGILLCIKVEGMLLPDSDPEKYIDTPEFREFLLKNNTVKKNKIKSLGRYKCVDFVEYTFNFVVTDYEGKGDITSPREFEKLIDSILEKLGFKKDYVDDFIYKEGNSFITAEVTNSATYFPAPIEEFYVTFAINTSDSSFTDDKSFIFEVEIPLGDVEAANKEIKEVFLKAKNSEHFKNGDIPDDNDEADAVRSDLEWELTHPDY